MAGWPLNVVLTPEGEPFYGMTYAPKDLFLGRMNELARQWQAQPDGIRAMARQAVTELQPASATPAAVDLQQAVRQLYREVAAEADRFEGGLGTQAKFPRTPLLIALLELQSAWPNDDIDAFLRTTLDAMADGGLRDGLKGGFFRYTVDPGWTHPHFEKMQYDNALLARLYLQAASHYDEPYYRQIGFDTLDFLLRFTAAGNGFYYSALSALDADGHEGGNYLWRAEELAAVLGEEEAERVLREWQWGALEGLPGRFPTHIPLNDPARETLAAAKPNPEPDVKTLTSWNALMLAAMAEAVSQPGGERYRELALALAQVLWGRFDPQNDRLLRDEGIDSLSLEDYAYLADALLRLSLIHI